MSSRHPAIDDICRREAVRVLATLIRLLGDFDLAEDARQEGYTAALEQWPTQGLPANPRAWLIRVGRNKGVDQLRRQKRFRSTPPELDWTATEPAAASHQEAAAPEGSDYPADEDAAFGDDRLRLIFTCCHPALSLEAQVALTLRTVCGIATPAVARAFLVSEDTLAQRLVRAKRKIIEARIPYGTPSPIELDGRIDGVLAVVYLVFTEGYAGTSGAEMISTELCREAIRLGRLLDALLPGNPAIQGLLALMLLHDARRHARVTAAGDIVLLEEQDRTLWDRAQIDEGSALVERALRTAGRIDPYAVQAAIAALHSRAATWQATDWLQIVGLYEVLLRLQATPVIELNHAVAVSMVDGPARALDLVDSLAARGSFLEYHLLAAARGHLLKRLGRPEEALAEYRSALAAAQLDPERRLLQGRIADISASLPTPTTL